MQRLTSRMFEFWIQTDQCTFQSKCVGFLGVEWSIIDLCFRLLYKHREDGKDGENVWSAILSYVLSNGVQCRFWSLYRQKNKYSDVGWLHQLEKSIWLGSSWCFVLWNGSGPSKDSFFFTQPLQVLIATWKHCKIAIEKRKTNQVWLFWENS